MGTEQKGQDRGRNAKELFEEQTYTNKDLEKNLWKKLGME